MYPTGLHDAAAILYVREVAYIQVVVRSKKMHLTYFNIFYFYRFNFQWLVLVIIGITLSMSNLLGYLRCKFGNANSVTNLANNYMRKQMFSSMFNMFTAKANAGGATPQAAPNQFI